MKRKTKAILSGLVIVAMTVSMLSYLTKLVENWDEYGKFRLFPFYEEKEDVDVIFLGSSHMYCTAFPMELWQDYGITSFNMGVSSSYLPETYWVLESVLEQDSPKMVVVDTFLLSAPEKVSLDSGATVHHFLDAVPFSITKLHMIHDLLSGTGYSTEFIWDFIVYHDRWETLTENDFNPVSSVEKGASMKTGLFVEKRPELSSNDELLSSDALGVKYLERILDVCSENNIDVLLTYMPFYFDKFSEIEANSMEKIAAERGINCINFLKKESLTNWKTDYSDIGHLNASGAQKATDYLGRYIMEHYDVPDRRGDPNYVGWYEDYKQYTQYKIGTIARQSELQNYLMLLYDKHLSPCIYLAPNDLWREDEIYSALLENIGIDPRALPEEPVLAVADHMGGEVSYLTVGETADTCFGSVALLPMDGGSCCVQIDGSEALVISSEVDAGAVVIDNADGSIATSACFAIADTTVNKVS